MITLKRVLDLGPRLRFAILNLALGLVEQAAFIELGIGAASCGDLSDHFTIFMLLTLLDPGVPCIRIHRIFIAVQQFGDLSNVGYIRSGSMNMVNLALLRVRADMRLHSKEKLVTFLRLMDLWIALALSSFLVELGA